MVIRLDFLLASRHKKRPMLSTSLHLSTFNSLRDYPSSPSSPVPGSLGVTLSLPLAVLPPSAFILQPSSLFPLTSYIIPHPSYFILRLSPTQQKMRIYAKKVNRMLVITEDLISRYQDDDGITYMNIYEFLLNEDCL